MELRHLRYFIGVAEDDDVSGAALKLHGPFATWGAANCNAYYSP